MARNTRSAMRANAILADSSQDTNPAPKTATPNKERAPLGIIDANNIATNEDNPTLDNSEPPAKPKSKGKKTKGGKKGTKQSVPEVDENVVGSISEVKEDESVSDTSDAVTKACEELMEHNNDVMKQIHVDNNMPSTPSSPAVEAVRMQLQEAQSTDLSSPTKTSIAEQLEPQKQNMIGGNGSVHEPLKSPVPNQTHPVTLEGEQVTEAEKPASVPSSHEDLSGRKTSSRSPPRPARIEDSVEAIDALEDAIEQIGEALPASRPSSAKRATPTKEHHSTQNGKVLKELKGNADGALLETNFTKASNKKAKPVNTPKVASSVAIKKAAPKPARNSIQPRAAATKPPSSRPSTAETTIPKPPSPKGSTPKPQGPAQSISNLTGPSTKQRPVSASLRAPLPLKKSTKPPTRSNFELPGEAISRKLKEQREERLKREEEEKQKKREFKARPIRRSVAPVVKPTAASRARASLLHGELAENHHTPKAKTPRVSTISANGDSLKRTSILTVPKRSSVLRAVANSSARRSTSNSSSNSTKVKPTTAFVPNSAVTLEEIAQQKLKGKEVFKRARLEEEELERKRKEKEDAAKLARIAAAERGRQASREWAEKQKRAKATAARKKGMEGGDGEVVKA
ncbi:MAG: hypothetical protein M1835_004850 [Candelina submexicana]|nr:MAG: hypothetical protein M1835_004850 [Candelina submexicana]